MCSRLRCSSPETSDVISSHCKFSNSLRNSSFSDRWRSSRHFVLLFDSNSSDWFEIRREHSMWNSLRSEAGRLRLKKIKLLNFRFLLSLKHKNIEIFEEWSVRKVFCLKIYCPLLTWTMKINMLIAFKTAMKVMMRTLLGSVLNQNLAEDGVRVQV